MTMKRGYKNVIIKCFIYSIILASFIAMSLPVYAQASASASKPGSPAKQGALVVKVGEIWQVSETTNLKTLTVEEGANVTAPDGYTVTMTVNGVETGQKLVDLKAADGATHIVPGSYKGNIVLTVAESNPTKSFKLRQALYLDTAGIVKEKSVLAAVTGKIQDPFNIKDIKISSTGECFNGIWVAGGSYSINNLKINFTGDGRSDFEGYGSAVMATGKDTRLVLDRLQIKNKGIVRTGVIAAEGSRVIVKNSVIETQDGEKPPYVLPQRGGSGLGGSIGMCRATVLLGTNTQASYINSTVTGTGWGLLASDMCYDFVIAAVNSKVAHTGDIGGYGAYCIDGNGNAKEYFLGTRMNVSATSVTLKGGHLFYGDSTREAVAQLNDELDWRLTDKELKSIPVKNTIINSKLFGIMCTSDKSTVNVSGRTIFNTGNTVFLNKGKDLQVTVDGSEGVRLNPGGNGVIMQLMDDDDPGMNNSAFSEATTPPVRDESFDLTSTSGASISTFSNISLKGDFYNSFGWGKNAAKSTATGGSGGAAGGAGGASGGSGGGMPESGMPGGATGGGMPGGAGGGMPGGSSGSPGGSMPSGGSGGAAGGAGGSGGTMQGSASVSGRNMAITFNNAGITGAISSSEAHHAKPELDLQKDYKLFGVVTNTAHEPINNGVIVSLTNGSNWKVTGTSYLTSLTIDAGSTITAAKGHKVTMTVDGIEKKIGAGEYKGLIMLTVTENI